MKSNDVKDPNINNATSDNAAFQNAARWAATPAISGAGGREASIPYVPMINQRSSSPAPSTVRCSRSMKVSGSSAPPPRPLGQVVFSQRHLRPGGAAPHRGLPRSHRHLRPHQHRRLPRDDTADNRFTLFTNTNSRATSRGGSWASAPTGPPSALTSPGSPAAAASCRPIPKATSSSSSCPTS